ncbi:extracellular solute-binding protein [Paenibacillus albiflavus]|uniref:Extracellular solute-binding protein n=1 Tax=Paenibacillus albiflavus TaxID=2545760 RepID=A0A4R4EF24_9BACL|nr:extracellular solute-binding protein [Paenibacillus albiflavus]TCZ77833.1 extracellular solute-binding protein [Paenibacillus albiflavus]
MRKAMLILFTFIMVMVSACSTSAGGNTGGAQTSNVGQTNTEQVKNGTGTTPPKGETSGTKNSTEKKTIVFSTYFSDDFFLEAKKRYEAKHPNITIDLQYIETSNENDEAAWEKFEKTTNAAMLSGKGPDLIQMDQLPSGDYVKKNLLANIGDMIDKDPSFQKEQYFNNVLDGIKVNGGIYGMPMGFFIYGLMGNETVIEKSGVKIDDSNWNWEQFTDLAKEIVKKAGGNHFALGGVAPENMIKDLVNGQYATFVDLESRKANFDSAAFIELLKEVKLMSDEKMIREDYGGIFYNEFINSPQTYIRELRNSDFLQKPYKSKFYSRPNASGQEAGGFFRTYKTIGINASSAVKDEAWDFIKFMLSDEMQDQGRGAGFSLNKATYKKVAQDVLKKGKVMSDQPVGPLKGKEFEITQKDIDDLEKFLIDAKYPVQFKPSKIDEILLKESKAYFTGQKSPEEVAKLIQNRVTTVLNE